MRQDIFFPDQTLDRNLEGVGAATQPSLHLLVQELDPGIFWEFVDLTRKNLHGVINSNKRESISQLSTRLVT